MKRYQDRLKSLLFILAANIAVIPLLALSAEVSPELQYKNLLARSAELRPVSEFGDVISYQTGALSFMTVDVDIPGKGPPVRAVRSAAPRRDPMPKQSSGNVFGHWELEIPRIATIVSNADEYIRAARVTNDSPIGWQVPGQDKNARCTKFGSPNPVFYDNSSIEFWPEDWWFGYRIHDGSGGSASLFVAAPGMLKAGKIATNNNWTFTCLPSTKNGEPGEGFLGVSPDGTKYWFDYLVYTDYPTLALSFENFPPKGQTLRFGLPRKVASMLVSRVEDRHGNWVQYNYQAGLLKSIVASDERRLDFSHSEGNISRIDANDRRWTYSYGEGTFKVTLPDNTRWLYSGNFGSSLTYTRDFEGCQQSYLTQNGSESGLSVDAPSGAKVAYTWQSRVFGRSKVPRLCSAATQSKPYGGYARVPRLSKDYAVDKRVVSIGTGHTYTWIYDYSPHNGSWKEDCEVSGCETTVWSDELMPDGNRIRRIYSNAYDQTEGKLLRELFYSADGMLLRSSEHAYAIIPSANENTFPWPVWIGLRGIGFGNEEAELRWTPLATTAIQEGSDKWTRHVSFFDILSRPVSMTESSSTTSRTRTIQYYDNLSQWVLGQTAKVTVNGLEESRTSFDVSTALPLQMCAFGKLEQTLTYNADGTVATVKDGNGNLTTLGSWKRGIPQSITHADGRAEKAVVNDHGWITARTDENGFTTSYTYDAMGRLASVTHPSDSVNWHATTYTFEQRPSAEHGLPGGHWLRRQNTGNHRKNTFLDALWRPVLVHEYDAADVEKTLRAVKTDYDHEGRVIFSSYPANARVPGVAGIWTEYDALGRPTSVSQDSEHGLLTTTTQYLSNARGPYIQTTDPNGGVTKTWYQMFDEPSYGQPVYIEQPEGVVTDIKRDVFGKPLEINRK